ncbi:hypothetical protein J3459_018267 [Metarhizium acridum]|uniref:uncharacterized protein n=1 Tax=Metarhizium acridum TaxID=92637 RepID=UPI001C6A9340|nr:hypothetical protein J3459_018608 [Metarhizium acridum]KAG8408031.1 hypothetical protein J3459_018267 [Metarhizium acridum]KAG8410216.1 hypothetical protein J3458_018252 [Metarhizium acridum]
MGVATFVGLGGVALSGGQKQRIVSNESVLVRISSMVYEDTRTYTQAIARTVYSRKKFIILDDVFSGLDNKTSRAFFQRLLGSDGLLRNDNQTVVLATNNVNLLEAADYITMSEQGKIVRNQVQNSTFNPQDWAVNQDETESNDSSSRVGGSESGHQVKQREADRAEAELSR